MLLLSRVRVLRLILKGATTQELLPPLLLLLLRCCGWPKGMLGLPCAARLQRQPLSPPSPPCRPPRCRRSGCNTPHGSTGTIRSIEVNTCIIHPIINDCFLPFAI